MMSFLWQHRCRNPTLAKCGGEAQHLEKLEVWSPLGLPNVQSSTARPKTPCIRVFLVSLERSWNADIENGLALAIWTATAQVMGKRKPGSQTGSRESTSSRRHLEECDTTLESSRQELQHWFKTRPNPSSGRGAMAVQSSGSLAGTLLGLHFGSPNKMCHSDVASTTSRKEYSKGEGGGFPPSPSRGESYVSKCPWQVPTPKGVPNAKLTRFGWFLDAADSHELHPLPSLIPGLPTRPSTPF